MNLYLKTVTCILLALVFRPGSAAAQPQAAPTAAAGSSSIRIYVKEKRAFLEIKPDTLNGRTIIRPKDYPEYLRFVFPDDDFIKYKIRFNEATGGEELILAFSCGTDAGCRRINLSDISDRTLTVRIAEGMIIGVGNQVVAYKLNAKNPYIAVTAEDATGRPAAETTRKTYDFLRDPHFRKFNEKGVYCRPWFKRAYSRWR